MGSNYYDDLLNNKISRKKRNEYIENLHIPPKKDKGVNMPSLTEIAPNIIHQADLLFLPDDNGYKYALVVVDVGSSITDAEPLKSKEQNVVLSAFKKIYNRDILSSLPKIMQVDAGNEFKGIVQNWFENQDIRYRIAKVGRHRQQAKVERRNQIIANALFKRMASQEAITGDVSKEWVDDLPLLITAMNKKTKKQNKYKKDKIPEKVLCEGDSCKLLPIGTKVRVALESPSDNISGKRLFGKFRSHDIRWSTEVRTIENIALKPKSPPLYILNKVSHEPTIGYTKNQLQVVSKEKYPDAKKVLRKKPTTYRMEEIVGKKKKGNKIFYKIKWIGYDETTYEPKSKVQKVAPDLIREYEKN